MRKLIQLIEDAQNAETIFYHGTSDISWREIKRTNKMIRMDEEAGLSFTRSKSVAEWFAKDAVIRDELDDAKNGIVIAFDAAKLRHDFKLEDHHDTRIDSAPDALDNEEEVRVVGEQISNIMSYVVGFEVVKL